MQNRDASPIGVITSALLPFSSIPHPALTCLTKLPELSVWKAQCNEGMNCLMNGSYCVIFTFIGSSVLVFHFNNSLIRSDKTDGWAIKHDNSPNVSNMPYLVLFFFTREKNQLHMLWFYHEIYSAKTFGTWMKIFKAFHSHVFVLFIERTGRPEVRRWKVNRNCTGMKRGGKTVCSHYGDLIRAFFHSQSK